MEMPQKRWPRPRKVHAGDGTRTPLPFCLRQKGCQRQQRQEKQPHGFHRLLYNLRSCLLSPLLCQSQKSNGMKSKEFDCYLGTSDRYPSVRSLLTTGTEYNVQSTQGNPFKAGVRCEASLISYVVKYCDG